MSTGQRRYAAREWVRETLRKMTDDAQHDLTNALAAAAEHYEEDSHTIALDKIAAAIEGSRLLGSRANRLQTGIEN